MDFSVPPPNMRIDPVGQSKFTNLNYNQRYQYQQPRPNGVKPTAPHHIRNLNFTQNQPVIPPSNYVVPPGQVPYQAPYRGPQPLQYQVCQPPNMFPAPVPAYHYQPPQPRFPPASLQYGGLASVRLNTDHNIATFQPPPGFTIPPQHQSVYNCPPPPPPPHVLLPPSPSPAVTSDIPDLRHQFLSTQFVGKPGQVIFLPPMSADKSVQTIQVLTPVSDQAPGQFTVQTIVLPIMVDTNSPCQPVSPPSHHPPLPAPPTTTVPVPAPLQEVNEDVMLNELDGTGLPKVMQGINLDQVKLFAAEFKAARQSLGLTQSQVGQALNSRVVEGETENISVSQSTICRFEKLEITALQVKKLLPALRSWLDWAKQRQVQGLPVLVGDGQEASKDTKKRKKRTVFNKETQKILSEEFDQSNSPSSTQLSEIADRLGLDRETVRVWFCNKRQSIRKQDTS